MFIRTLRIYFPIRVNFGVRDELINLLSLRVCKDRRREIRPLITRVNKITFTRVP